MDIKIRAPINKQAALVISSGTHYNPKLNIYRNGESDTALPVEKINSVYCGYKFGFFTVIGKSVDKKNKLVSRCLCGRYALRSVREIKKNKGNGDRCLSCQNTRNLQSIAGDDFKKTVRKIKDVSKSHDQRMMAFLSLKHNGVPISLIANELEMTTYEVRRMIKCAESAELDILAEARKRI